MFEQLAEGIFRLCIPFDTIYTTVFLLLEQENCGLIDSGADEADVLDYILPAVHAMGAKPSFLICSHSHGDHSGGMQTLRTAFPKAKVGMFPLEIMRKEGQRIPSESFHFFSDGEILWDRFQMLNLKGHSADSLGVYDRKTETLLSFDSLQMYGVGHYGTGVQDHRAYRSTIQRIRKLNPERIIASHDYVPDGFRAEGKAAVGHYLDQCEEASELLVQFRKEHMHLSGAEAAKRYHERYPHLPPIGAYEADCAKYGMQEGHQRENGKEEKNRENSEEKTQNQKGTADYEE